MIKTGGPGILSIYTKSASKTTGSENFVIQNEVDIDL